MTDHRGSVIGLADEDGELTTSYTYDPHGQRTIDGDEDPNQFGWAGREHDETGLIYHRVRYWHPDLGRFISEDPLGYAAGDTNLYA